MVTYTTITIETTPAEMRPTMYFDWTKYPFRTPPELRGLSSGARVAVIGAGPVGMALALALGRQGIRTVLLEARDQVSDGSRAISLDTLSMRILDRLGVGAAFAARCIEREENIVQYQDTLVYQMEYRRDARQKHDQFNILQQCWMEQLLLAGLNDCETVDLRWHSRVTDVAQDDAGVTLIVETPEGPYSLQVDYAVATDGGRGETRRRLGIAYESVTEEQISERPFIICDFKLDTTMSKARRFYLDPPYKRGATVLLHAQPFETWRLDYSIEDDEDAEAEARPERVRARLEAHLAMIGETATPEILWTSVYRPRAVTAERYRQGRVFLAGDAAHLSPIFGGRGLNMGFGDAFNLAWRLAYVLEGKASEALLDGYGPERRGMVCKTLGDLSQAAVFMARPSRGVTLMCNAVLELVPHEPFVRDLFDAHRAPKREGYSPSADWNDDPPRGAWPGNPLPNVQLQTGWLCDLLPEGFSVVAVAADGLPAEVEHALALPVTVIGGTQDPQGLALRDLAAEQGTLLLIRPDGYVAARAAGFDPEPIRAALARLLDGQHHPQEEHAHV